jgi:putative chitinase
MSWPILHRDLFDNDDVERMQLRLRHHGWKIAVDGDFGPASELALKAFQAANDVAPTGITDPVTWAELEKD